MKKISPGALMCACSSKFGILIY